MGNKRNIHVANQREPSRRSRTKKSSTNKINLIIQIRGNEENDILKIKIPSNTSIGKIKKYLADKYGMNEDYIYLTGVDPNSKRNRKSTGEEEENKVDIVFKTSIGSETEEARLRVPRNVKINTLKEALAKKFGLTSDDFELMHLSKEARN